MTNQTIINAQKIFTRKEKDAWDKFESIRDKKYEGKGSRAIKEAAVDAARVILKEELKAAENEYAKSVGAI